MHQLVTASKRVARTISVRGEDLLHVPAAAVREIVDVKPRRLFRRGAQVRIESEISQDQVLSAVAAQVERLHGIPPSIRARQSCFPGAIDELAVLLVKYPHRHPFTDDYEVELAIVVVVDPRGRRDHSCFRQLRGDL